ncbi:excisionase family DNA-binding protein [Anaerobacillus sp. MEB173]|uniref:excisionase family DNA-binding protein n=1 Tax=Anaerobacillus sp. MEB173 TaxID=3383345 RepID=UPI003F9335F1
MFLYVTIEQLAQYLQLPEDYLLDQIYFGHLRAIHDGEQYLVNQDQFKWHKEQIEKCIEQWKNSQDDPIPEDIDVKDED